MNFFFQLIKHTKPIYVFIAGVFCCSFCPVHAQIAEKVYQRNYVIDPAKERQLSFEIDNISFFKNNEFAGEFAKGYSLPGFWIQPKAVYYPLSNIKLELGAHMLLYHGTIKYPSLAYMDIAEWKGGQYQTGMHLLPWFRAQAKISDHVNIILGNIYGGSNHRLIDPLYSKELNLTADPETGVQLLLDTKVITLDTWLNWQSFIFRDDTHQEAFTFGASSRILYNDPSRKFHFYSPIQLLAQHRGGEIDTITTNSVQTVMNAAVGVGMLWNVNYGILKNINVELDATGYIQPAGELWPLDKGYGQYTRISADIADFRLTTAHWRSNDFISMFGVPFYSSLSSRNKGAVFEQPEMIYLGLEYTRTFGKGFALGVDFDMYYTFGDRILFPDKGWQSVGSATSYSFGIYFRANPSFLLKAF